MLIQMLASVFVVSAFGAVDADAALDGPAIHSASCASEQEPSYASEQQPITQAAARHKPKRATKRAKTTLPSADEETRDGSDQAGSGSGIGLIWKKHPSFRYGSILRLDFEAQFQEDARTSYTGAKGSAGLAPFDLHRNRLGIQGKLLHRVEFEVKRELTEKELTDEQLSAGKLPKAPWKDVFVNVGYIESLQVQAGKFKIPFGLDELTGVTHNDFVFRSLGANYLAPSRDVGAQVHGNLFREALSYSAGLFKQDGDNARSSKILGANRTFAARVSGMPFGRALAALGTVRLGTAFTDSVLSNDSFAPNGLRGRTVMTHDTFFHAVYVQGRRRRWEGDIDWTSGPLSARAEYTLVRDQRQQQGLGNEDLSDARYSAWYVSGTWVLTGEEKRRPVKPAHDFLQGGLGAVELAGRYEHLWFGSAGASSELPLRAPRAENILPNGDRVLTLGVNWSLNRFIKLQFNGIREHVDDPTRSPQSGSPFWSRVLRLQFVL